MPEEEMPAAVAYRLIKYVKGMLLVNHSYLTILGMISLWMALPLSSKLALFL